MGRWIVLVMIFFTIGVSLAHYPIFAPKQINSFESTLLIKDADVSNAIYAKLGKNEIDYYKFEVKESLELYVNILVPYKKSNKDFIPSFAIVGPGLSEPQRDSPIKELPAGYGIMQFVPTHTDFTEINYESFTDTRYLKGMEYETKIEQEGVYYIIVYTKREDDFGDYVLVTGREDRFRLFDLFNYVFSYFRIKWLFWLS